MTLTLDKGETIKTNLLNKSFALWRCVAKSLDGSTHPTNPISRFSLKQLTQKPVILAFLVSRFIGLTGDFVTCMNHQLIAYRMKEQVKLRENLNCSHALKLKVALIGRHDECADNHWTNKDEQLNRVILQQMSQSPGSPPMKMVHTLSSIY